MYQTEFMDHLHQWQLSQKTLKDAKNKNRTNIFIAMDTYNILKFYGSGVLE
jgi:hypothetical protein